MTEFRVVTEDELRPVLETLTSLDWPVPFDSFPVIFHRLGWEKQRRKGGMTSLPVSLRIVSVGELDGEISRIDFRISDTVQDQKVVKGAFPAAARVVEACLGAPPTGTPWVSPGVSWDLEDGCRINVLQGESAISLQYWSKRKADIERFERSRGIDPDHSLEDRE